MTSNSINPYIRVAMRSVLGPYHRIGSRIIYDYELVYVERGSFAFEYDGKKYDVEPGSFIFIRPGIPHKFRGIGVEVSQPHIHFDLQYDADSESIPVSFKDIDGFSPSERSKIREDVFAGFPRLPYVTFSEKSKALDLFYEIIELQRQHVLKRKGLLVMLIDMLISDNFTGAIDAQQSLDYSIARQIKDYIDAGQGMALSLGELADQFSYSRYYLERRFKEEYGVGIIAYRNKMRMAASRVMLESGMSVTEVAEKTGFSSIYSFSRAYKDCYGIPPSRA